MAEIARGWGNFVGEWISFCVTTAIASDIVGRGLAPAVFPRVQYQDKLSNMNCTANLIPLINASRSLTISRIP